MTEAELSLLLQLRSELASTRAVLLRDYSTLRKQMEIIKTPPTQPGVLRGPVSNYMPRSLPPTRCVRCESENRRDRSQNPIGFRPPSTPGFD